MGSGAVLGVAPAPEYTFVIFVAPVGTYFKVLFVLLDAKRLHPTTYNYTSQQKKWIILCLVYLRLLVWQRSLSFLNVKYLSFCRSECFVAF